MTAAIKTSLNQLNQALESLETTAKETKEKSKKRQKGAAPDLFSVPKKAPDDVDAKALASRLDGAIAKVEKLLREGDEAHG